MTAEPPGDRDSRWGAVGAPRWLLALLPVALFLLPPETRGSAAVAIAMAIALATVAALVRGTSTPLAWGLAAAGVAAWPLTLLAEAPGPARPAIALPIVALACAAIGAAFGSDAAGRRFAAVGLAAGGTLVAIHGVLQAAFGLDVARAELELQRESLPHAADVLGRLASGRAFAAFSTPAALGGALVLALPATLGLALASRGRGRALALAAGAVQLLGLVASRSVTAALALLGAVVIAAAVHRGGRRWLGPAVVLAAVVVGSVVLLRGAELTAAAGTSHPLRLRAANARSAAAMAVAHPWTGVGIGGFAESYPRFRVEGANDSRHAHNLPLELIAELGFPLGLIVASAFFVASCGPLLRRDPGSDPQSFLLAAGLAAFALHNLADFTAYLPSVLWAAGTVRGALASPACADERGAPAWLGPAAAAVAIGACAVSASAAVSWDARWNAVVAGAAGDHDRALAEASRAVQWAPYDPDAHLQRALATLAADPPPVDVATLEAACASADAAVWWSPERLGARTLRAKLREALGDPGGALADLEVVCRATRPDPACERERRRIADALAARGTPR